MVIDSSFGSAEASESDSTSESSHGSVSKEMMEKLMAGAHGGSFSWSSSHGGNISKDMMEKLMAGAHGGSFSWSSSHGGNISKEMMEKLMAGAHGGSFSWASSHGGKMGGGNISKDMMEKLIAGGHSGSFSWSSSHGGSGDLSMEMMEKLIKACQNSASCSWWYLGSLVRRHAQICDPSGCCHFCLIRSKPLPHIHRLVESCFAGRFSGGHSCCAWP